MKGREVVSRGILWVLGWFFRLGGCIMEFFIFGNFRN